MSYPTKEVRQICYHARDKFWECLDANNENEQACMKFRNEFEKNCSEVWVKHFNRKRKYEKFKKEMDESEYFQTQDKPPREGKK